MIRGGDSETFTLSLPGHGISWQDLVSRLRPTQSLPPKAGRGWVHRRVRCCVPDPHVLEHCSQSFQSLQPPSTAKTISRLLIKEFSLTLAQWQVLPVSRVSNWKRQGVSISVPTWTNFFTAFSRFVSAPHTVIATIGGSRAAACSRTSFPSNPTSSWTRRPVDPLTPLTVN